MTLPQHTRSAAEGLSQALRAHSLTVTTVESCTGGLVGASITALPGSSDVYPGGFITYSNPLKVSAVGVRQDTIDSHGAVSSQAAIEMARGGREHAGADWAIAITGIAGPGGGSEEKPVGTVWICISGPGSVCDCRRFLFPGDRDQVRQASATTAMTMLTRRLNAGGAEVLEHEQEQYPA